MKDAMSRDKMKRIIVESLPRAGQYSHAVISGDLVFISGVTGQTTQENSLTEQFDESVRKIEKILAEASSSISYVVKVTAYLSDQKFFQEFNRLFNNIFTSAPVRTTIVCGFVNSLVKIELDVIAAKSK